MLRERYAAINIFEFVPTLAATVDPVLTRLDHLLEDDQLFQLVKADLLQRFPPDQLEWPSFYAGRGNLTDAGG